MAKMDASESPANVSPRPGLARAVVKELRVTQWAKNALVAVPALLAPGLPDRARLFQVLVAVLSFSFCASAGYVLNDLLDVDADRAHPTKRNRPFASGALPIAFGPPLFVALLVASVGLSWWALPKGFLAMLVLYFVGTIAYSTYFKKLLLVDVFVLASLYTLRILAGGVATSVPISAWLLGFSIFLFLSLALAKRYVEIRGLEEEGRIKNRNYGRTDLHMVSSLGASSGYLASLVFTLYVEIGAHANVYRQPGVLWLAALVLLYWISRIWVLAGRGEMQDDPVKFALTDRISILCGLAFVAATALARFWPAWLTGAMGMVFGSSA